MRNFMIKLAVLLVFICTSANILKSQNNLTPPLAYEVNKVYPFISISKENLLKARTIQDLNSRFPASWVSDYISVTVLASNHGKSCQALSKTDIFNQEQINILTNVDMGTDISIKVQYIPKNT